MLAVVHDLAEAHGKSSIGSHNQVLGTDKN